MKFFKKLYHDIVSVVLLARVFLTLVVCRDCKIHDDATGLSIPCKKHKKKLDRLDHRAFDHFEKTLK